MPNHVTNILEFSGDAKKIYDMLSYIKYDDQSLGSFDFNKILPMPKTLNLTSGSTTIDAVNVYMSAINPQNAKLVGTGYSASKNSNNRESATTATPAPTKIGASNFRLSFHSLFRCVMA